MQDSSGRPFLEAWRVLVVGAGGLGCEVLKCLAMSGFQRITIVDCDTVSESNLNRQFLYRPHDVGHPKAKVAAKRLQSRFSWKRLEVTAIVGRVEDQCCDFFKEFHMIIAGLDSVESRRWLNSILHELIERDPVTGTPVSSSVKPLLDGGTTGFAGQSRVILPSKTSCFECSLSLFPSNEERLPLCTVAGIPRRPEHCVEYALMVNWETEFPGTFPVLEDDQHVQWLFNKAVERAKMFQMENEMTWSFFQGVVKRVTPSIASTQAVIAASLVTEALKLATGQGTVLNNYWMYTGEDGLHTYAFNYQAERGCVICGGERSAYALEVPATLPLKVFLQKLKDHPKLKFERPTLRWKDHILWMSHPPSVRRQFERRLDSPMHELFSVADVATEGLKSTAGGDLVEGIH